MAFLEIIREKNQFPIIFIGSGITQRYFENSPTWEGLLKEIWLELFDEEDFYAKIYELKNEYNDDLHSIELKKGLIKITNFGMDFCEICI